jgi:tRNA (guanine6-N2)-methyltransferase
VVLAGPQFSQTAGRQGPLNGAMKVWVRVVRGLEWIAAAEAHTLLGARDCGIEHRGVVFECGAEPDYDRLRCADDVFIVWGEFAGLDPRRAGLGDLARHFASLSEPPISIPPGAERIRVTASFLGRRNYTRYEIEDVVGEALAKKLGLGYAASRGAVADNAVWCRLHADSEATRLGLRARPQPLHRRPWRTRPLAGSLHPPVAAAIARLADLRPGQQVLDPFTGTATLLIEAGLQCSGLDLTGCDISAAALSRARTHAALAGVTIALSESDAARSALVPADRLVSNPPWGRAAAAGGALTPDNLPDSLLRHLAPGARAVVLAERDLALPDGLADLGFLPLLTQSIRLSGRLAEVVVIGPPPLFPDIPFGRNLEHFLARASFGGTNPS